MLIRTVLAFVLALVAVAAGAQSLTNAQVTTLRNDILGRANLAQAVTNADDQAIADWYNAPAQNGEFAAPLTCWRPDFRLGELNAAIDWAAHAALSQAKQLTYLAMTQTGVIDLTDNQVRAGITAIYGAASASEVGIFSAGAQAGTRFEVMYGNVRGANRRCLFYGQRLTPQVVSNVLRP